MLDLLAASPGTGVVEEFLPIVLSILGLFAAAATAVGAVAGLRAARHRSNVQATATGDLIDALTEAEADKRELREQVAEQAERIAAQRAHIEYADRLLEDQGVRLREQGERIHYLERQEERWQERITELEHLVWAGSPPRETPSAPGAPSSPPPSPPPS